MRLRVAPHTNRATALAAAPQDHVPPLLGGIGETALITLYNRACEARRPDRLLEDPLAVELLNALDYPFHERFGPPDLAHVVRALLFDRFVSQFLRDHPGATVVSLGEGLETQLWRVDDGTLTWVTVDLEPVVALRRRLLPAHPRNRLLSGSALDRSWTEMLATGQPTLIVAQGLLMYFTREQVEALIALVSAQCPGATLIFDTIPSWAETRTGHRQTAEYRMPPQPWGAGERGIRSIARRQPAVVDVRFLPAPRARGVWWGVLSPTISRIAGLRGLLPVTVVLNTDSPDHTGVFKRTPATDSSGTAWS